MQLYGASVCNQEQLSKPVAVYKSQHRHQEHNGVAKAEFSNRALHRLIIPLQLSQQWGEDKIWKIKDKSLTSPLLRGVSLPQLFVGQCHFRLFQGEILAAALP